MGYLTFTEKDDVSIVGFGGLQRIDNDNFEELEKELCNSVRDLKDKIIFDFRGIKDLRSFALNMVIHFFEDVREWRKKVRFCGMCERVQDIFEIAGLAGILQIDVTDADSLKAFEAPPS